MFVYGRMSSLTAGQAAGSMDTIPTMPAVLSAAV